MTSDGQGASTSATLSADAHAKMESWKTISSRKFNDRKILLDKRPEWKLNHDVPDSVKDVSVYVAQHLTSREYDIVLHDATELCKHLQEGLYSAVEVLVAYCKVATIMQECTNCLTEIMFDKGLARAKELDDYLSQKGKTVGPLHGLPVSVKDHIKVEGHDTSTGYTSWCYNTVAKEDAVAVKILRQAGAVLYVKTANPQTLLSLETNNNIYGRTSNPFNRDLTPGGSSGGESALIATYGSPLGIGTDIGGSIRVPAAYMGLYGFKASVGRMPHAGLMGSHDGMEAIIGVLGPLARSARDLSLFCRTMLQYEPWLVEPPLLEIPWRQNVVDGDGIPKKLSIGILWDDGVVSPHPPILAALKAAKDALVAAGHEVIQWFPLDHQESWDLIRKLYFLDGGQEYLDTLAKDPPVPQTEWILGQVPNGGKPFTIAETFELNRQREAFRYNVAQHWNKTAKRTSTGRHVDAVISPCAATLAAPHDSTRWWGYSSYWNLVDYPAAVFPIGVVHKAHGYVPPVLLPDYKGPETPRNSVEAYVKAQWDPITYDNAPVSLQLIGRRLNEEKVLGILNVVEDAVRRYKSSRHI